MITVSHDRYFIKQIVNRVLEVKDGTLQDYAGDYNVSPGLDLLFLHFLISTNETRSNTTFLITTVLSGEESRSEREGA